MIKVITALPRREDVTRTHFQRHWGTIHREHALSIDRISRYVQSHTTDTSLPGFADSAFDGFPEVWFRDLDTAIALGKDPQYTQGAHLDEPRFIAVERMVRTWVTPELIRPWARYPTSTDAGKILLLCAAPATQDVRDRLVEAALRVDPLRLVVGTAIDDERVRARQGFGHVVEMWFANTDEADSAWRGHSQSFVSGLQSVMDISRSTAALVDERRVRWPGDVVDAD